MAANVDIRWMNGVGPEQSLIERHLLRADGSLRSQAEVGAEVGDQQAVLALLEYHLRERINTPSTRGYPPRIFLSYRRESRSHIAWCEHLARGLESAGYRVYLDSLQSWKGAFNPDVVAEFVAKLAESDIVVPIITTSYLGSETESSMRAWIWEEWSRIATLRDWGFLEVVAVWRSGDLSAAKAVRISGALDWTIDVRASKWSPGEAESPDIRAVLEYFGDSNGRRLLTDEQQDVLARTASAIIQHGRDRGPHWCETTLRSIDELHDTEEYWLAAAWASLAAGDRTALLEAAVNVFRLNASLPTSFSVAKALWLGDLDAHAVGLLAEVAEGPSLWRHQAHAILADVFKNIGMWPSAANHYRWVIAANQEDRLGGRWSVLGADAIATARQNLDLIEEALQGDHRTIARHCEFCDADYYTGTSVCGLCAAQYINPTDRCFFCGAGVVPVGSFTFCVICRKGWIDGEAPGANHLLVPREPGGRFSVLSKVAAPFPPSLHAEEPRPLGSWQQFVEF